MSQPSSLKRITSPDSGTEWNWGLDSGIGLKEVWEILLKVGFGFPSCFFFCVMVPLNFEHLDSFSSSASLFSV
jgi:hypothetical protein